MQIDSTPIPDDELTSIVRSDIRTGLLTNRELAGFLDLMIGFLADAEAEIASRGIDPRS